MEVEVCILGSVTCLSRGVAEGRSAGGFYAREIARALDPGQGFFIIPPKPFDGSAESCTIEGMATLHLRAVRWEQPQGPYLLGGFYVGALVALEMARQLRAAGERVGLMLVIDASVFNARFRAVYPLVRTISRLARSTPMARTALRAYLMGRVRRLLQLPAGVLALYLAGFPFRLCRTQAPPPPRSEHSPDGSRHRRNAGCAESAAPDSHASPACADGVPAPAL